MLARKERLCIYAQVKIHEGLSMFDGKINTSKSWGKMTKQIAIRTEVDEDLHIKFKSICVLEGISLKDKTAELIKEYVEQKEKK